MANGEWRIGICVDRPPDQFLPGPDSVAGRDGIGRILLPIDEGVPARRAVRNDLANPALSIVYPGEYRRGAWAREHPVVRAIFAYRARIAQRTRNASAVVGASWTIEQQADRDPYGSVCVAWQENSGP